jgi:hypothetical protein
MAYTASAHILHLHFTLDLDRKPSRIGFVRRTQNSPTLGENIAHVIVPQFLHPILDQPQEAIMYAYDSHPVVIDSGFGDSPNDGIETGAIPAPGQHTDCLCPFGEPEKKIWIYQWVLLFSSVSR